jgi:hypothetical protein
MINLQSTELWVMMDSFGGSLKVPRARIYFITAGTRI